MESVFGCLLFIIYISDFPKLKRGKAIMYADDTSIQGMGIIQRRYK
jgi:hypothetical protein